MRDLIVTIFGSDYSGIKVPMPLENVKENVLHVKNTFSKLEESVLTEWWDKFFHNSPPTIGGILGAIVQDRWSVPLWVAEVMLIACFQELFVA